MHFCSQLFEKEYALKVIEIIKKHSPADWNRLRRGIQEKKGTNYICRDSSDGRYIGDIMQNKADGYMKEFSAKLNISLESKNNTQGNSGEENIPNTQENSVSDNNDSFEERLIKIQRVPVNKTENKKESIIER